MTLSLAELPSLGPDLMNDETAKGRIIKATANPAIRYTLSSFRNFDNIFMANLLLVIIVGNVVNDKAKAQLMTRKEKSVGLCD